MNLAHQEERDKLQSKIQQLQQELALKIDSLEEQIRQQKNELDKARNKSQKDIGEKNSLIAKLQLQNEELNKQFNQESSKNKNQIDQLQQELGKANIELQKMRKENQQLKDKLLKDISDDGKNTASSSECGDTMSGIQSPQSSIKQPNNNSMILQNRLKQLVDDIDAKRKQLSDMQTNINILKTELACEREKTKVFPKIAEIRDDLQNKLSKSEREKAQLYQRLIDVTNKLVLKDNELDSTNRIVFDLKQELSIKKISDLERDSASKPQSLPKEKPVYRAMDPSDEIDTKLSQILNFTGCSVPINRLKNGVYMFGSRKITAKMQGGKLVIRVGGGFMVVQEFINIYGQQELMKMEQSMLKKEGLQIDKLNSQPQYIHSHHQSLINESQFSISPMKDAYGGGVSALQAYATNSSKVKPKPIIPKLNTNLSIQGQRRSSAFVGGGGGFSSFKTPLKSDRDGNKPDNNILGSKSALKRMNSSKQFLNTGETQNKLTSNKSKDELHKTSTKQRKSNVGFQRASSYYQGDIKTRKKSSLIESDFTAEMIAQLADQNENPLSNTKATGKKLFEEGKGSKIKIDTALNGGSTRVRNFNNKEISAIRMLANQRAGKSEKQKAVKDISKSMMIHDRKFQTSEEVEECHASFEDDNTRIF